MSETSDFHLWIDRAEEDYQLSLSALRRKVPLTYGATFHAQQCGEKCLKALLTLQGISFPRTHDLAALGNLCQRAMGSFCLSARTILSACLRML